MESVFGEIEPAVGLALNSHLEQCETCRAEEQRLIALRVGVRGATAPATSALRERLRQALRRAPERAPWLARPVPAYVALAAAVLSGLLVAGALRAWPARVAAVPEPAPAATPAGEVASRYFTSASCYVTGVDSSFRPTPFGGAEPRRSSPGADSL